VVVSSGLGLQKIQANGWVAIRSRTTSDQPSPVVAQSHAELLLHA
jgi:hypothetical protein